MLKDTVQLSQNYTLTYCSSPGRSYIIEPHGGELNYKMAEKNLNKFFEQVFNQQITQHKLKESRGESEANLYHKHRCEVISKVTKRPYLKIMEKIRMKLHEKLREKIGERHSEDIYLALNDRKIEESIKRMMKEERIRLLNDKKQPVYTEQIAQAANHDDVNGAHIAEATLEELHQHNSIEEEKIGFEPDQTYAVHAQGNPAPMHMSMKTTLEMKEFDLQMIEREVLNHMRQNSKKY